MRNDPFNGGQGAYAEIKKTLVRGQRCVCAYCEIRIAADTSDAAVDADKSLQRVEHFHPKSDLTRPPNWALHWPNLWAVCMGGDQKPPTGEPLNPAYYLPPLPENLSCDAHKAYQIETGKLDPNPDGWILNPGEVPAFPNLFAYAPDGTPEPDLGNCGAAVIPGNRHPDTARLVAATIEHLNLGCPRLNRIRCIVKAQLEKLIQRAREQNVGANSQLVLLNLARRLFSTGGISAWPEFFTLIRWRLGEPAEARLREMAFAG